MKGLKHQDLRNRVSVKGEAERTAFRNDADESLSRVVDVSS